MKKILLTLVSFAIASTAIKAQMWTMIPYASPNMLWSCSFGSPSVVYAVGGTGLATTIVKSINGGNTFTHLPTTFLPADNNLFSCYFTNADTGFIAGSDYNPSPSSHGFIYKTTNGGLSWTSVLSGAINQLMYISFPSDNVGYACGGLYSITNPGMIYKSTNNGNTWSVLYTAPGISSLVNGWFINDSTGYFVGSDNASHAAKIVAIKHGLVYSDNNMPAYLAFHAVCFTSADTGFITATDTGSAGNKHVLRTTDGGITWLPVYATTSTIPTQAIKFANHNVGYAIGDRNLMTTDAGNTWVPFNPITPGAGTLAGIDFKDSIGIIVGELTGVLRKGPVTAVAEIGQQHFSISPNPMIASTTITLKQVLKDAKVTLTDITGKVVREYNVNDTQLTIEKESMKPGIYTVTIAVLNNVIGNTQLLVN